MRTAFRPFRQERSGHFHSLERNSSLVRDWNLPAYKPKAPKLDIPIVQSVAGSTLCSISSSAWARVSGHKLMSMQHMERCSRLVADVAMQAVTLLNDYGTGKSPVKKG